ncbi:MAG TPA: universal stress protein [Gammaproteobacteria bacterium]|jgi:universal stress protein E|nr:universal stress protein [Gammaproteobacteria bacterium]
MPGQATGATELQRIIVAIKPWERGLPLAATHARQLAKSVGAEIRLVSTVFQTGVAVGRELGDTDAQTRGERLLTAARMELQRLAHSMRDWGTNVTTQAVWSASVCDGILSVVQEWQADLVVVGVHEQRPLHTRLTDTDWQLMQRSPCPLLLVKDPVFDGYRTIVAAIDPLHAHAEPSGLDRSVLSAGRAFARAFGSTLRAVNAYPGEGAFELASAVQVAPGVFYGAENVAALHRRAAIELVAEFGITPAETDLVEGSPAEVIVDTAAARRAQLVVVGVPQRRGRLAAVVGSTAEAVAAEAPCDVLLVPAVQR